MGNRWILPTLGLVLMGIGYLQGQHLTVLKKAVRICLECIGVG